MFTPSDNVDIDVKTGFTDSVQSGSRSSSVIGRNEGPRSATPIRLDSTTTPRTPAVRIRRSSERPSSIRHQDSMFSQASTVLQVTSGDVKGRELSRRRRQATALRSVTKELGTKGDSSGDADETYAMGGDFDNEGEVCSMVDGSVVVFRTYDTEDDRSTYLAREVDTVNADAAVAVVKEEEIKKEVESVNSSYDSDVQAAESIEATAPTPTPTPVPVPAPVPVPVPVPAPASIVDPIFALFDFSSYYS